MRPIHKLKFRRFINRRSNTIIEQLEKWIRRLHALIERLDQEQDEANRLMKEEILRIEDKAATTIQDLEAQIAKIEAQRDADIETTADEFTTLIAESAQEAERARKIEGNIKAIAQVKD